MGRRVSLLCVVMLTAGMIIGRASVALPASARASTGAPSPFARFAGSWLHHGGLLYVSGDGKGVHRFRTYVNCTTNRLTACDKFLGSAIYDGGYVAFSLTRVSGNRATGTITVSSFSWQIGQPFTLVLKPNDTMQVREPGYPATVCGSRAPAGACGA